VITKAEQKIFLLSHKLSANWAWEECDKEMLCIDTIFVRFPIFFGMWLPHNEGHMLSVDWVYKSSKPGFIFHYKVSALLFAHALTNKMKKLQYGNTPQSCDCCEKRKARFINFTKNSNCSRTHTHALNATKCESAQRSGERESRSAHMCVCMSNAVFSMLKRRNFFFFNLATAK